MAEFCLDFMNKYNSEENGPPVKEKDVVMSFDLCEGCGEWKQCVVRFKKRKYNLRRIIK